MISEGEAAPGFELPDAEEKMVKLKDFSGKRVVLYFYPKDDTPGCTAEACGFRDNMPKFQKLGVPVLGISPDSESSHVVFAGKYGLNFTLLSDAGGKVAMEYGVWGEKQFGAVRFVGNLRTTFIIGKGGKVEKVFANVKPEGHEKEVLGWLGAH
jgi:thioredoxin-dependent peroxiredoxin